MITMEEGTMKVLCLNAFLRPPGIKCGSLFGSGDYKDLRLALLIEKIAQYDIVLLQEVFEIGNRQSILVKAAYDAGLVYHAGSVWPKLFSPHIIDGGLLILSRYPIVLRDTIVFKKGSGADGVCSKGVLYAKILMSPQQNDALHVFTTHTQAGEGKREFAIRKIQIIELATFIQKKISDSPAMPVLIGGDFNLDARHNYEHRSGQVTLTRCVESQLYKWLEDLLKESCCDYNVVNLLKCYSKSTEIHPITNGHGHGRLCKNAKVAGGRVSVEQCIDYLFLCTPRETGKRSGSLELIPGETRVDKCLVDCLPSRQSKKDMILPISQLSDHYGIESILTYKTNARMNWGLELDSYAKLLMHCFPPLSFRQQKPLGWSTKVHIIMAAIAAGILGGLGVF